MVNPVEALLSTRLETAVKLKSDDKAFLFGRAAKVMY